MKDVMHSQDLRGLQAKMSHIKPTASGKAAHKHY